MTTGQTEETHAWRFEHEGDDIKATAVAGAEMTLAAKMKEAFQADGLFYKAMESVKENLRGPKDYPPRRRPHYLKLMNGDEGGYGDSPLLPWIFALLLIILVGVGVALHKLSNIEKGQYDEQRRAELERTATTDGAP